MLNLQVILDDGRTYYGNSAEEVLHHMRENSWDSTVSLIDFKKDMAYRVEMRGIVLVFWNATSFLFALQKAGMCEIIIGVNQNEKKN